MNQGDRREAIFLKDHDRELFIATLRKKWTRQRTMFRLRVLKTYPASTKLQNVVFGGSLKFGFAAALLLFGSTTFQAGIARDYVFNQKLVANDAKAGARFGAVGVDGDTLIVGAFGDTIGGNLSQGSAYIYVRQGAAWVFQQKLTADDGASGDNFGRSVGISSNTVVIGAHQDTYGSMAAHQGSAYVFVRNGTTWTQQAKLTADDSSGGDLFGEYSRIDGETIIVGARGSDRLTPSTQIDSGAAYVYVRNGTTWTQQGKLIADDGVGGDNFGMSADVSRDTAIVGAWFDAEGINSQQGSAYIFTRNVAGVWSQRTKILAPDGLAGDWFGIGCAIDRGTVVIGARHDNLNPGTPGSGNGPGSAYLYVGSGATWTLQQKISASDFSVGAAFGESVAIDGDNVLVGAVFDHNKGAAYLYSRNGTVWTERQKFVAIDRFGVADGAVSDYFSDFVSISGRTLVASSYGDDTSTTKDHGSAYIFDSGPQEGSLDIASTLSPGQFDFAWLPTIAFPEDLSTLQKSVSPGGPWSAVLGDPAFTIIQSPGTDGLVHVSVGFSSAVPERTFFRLRPAP